MHRRIVMLGAAGRDFHNFNVRFRDSETDRVVAFTATQIPGIAGRRYPPETRRTVLPPRNPHRAGGPVGRDPAASGH